MTDNDCGRLNRRENNAQILGTEIPISDIRYNISEVPSQDSKIQVSCLENVRMPLKVLIYSRTMMSMWLPQKIP